ncbi:MAG TPA: hypothetical protein VFV50_18190 [Bdellovibrionales bacterium]|nr:hypothetical protein [Bdellovibrionales bacterium]
MSIIPPISAILTAALITATALGAEVPVDGEGEKRPFWKAPGVYEGIVDKRDLAVSAKIEKGAAKSDKERLQVVAAGHVSVPLSYAWAKVREFERLPKVSSHFKNAEYFPDRKRLHLIVTALGYQAFLVLHLKFIDEVKYKEIRWETTEGAFTGMTGTIRLEDFERRRTEMSLYSEHESKKLPLPDAIKSIMIEVVSQRVAGLMREYIEGEYKKDLKKSAVKQTPAAKGPGQ